jgi:hypothetical protein
MRSWWPVSDSSSRLRPKLGLLWLLLFVLVRLQVAAHQAFTPHVVCPLDGELAHAHAEESEDRHAPAEPESGGPRGGHDEHCGLEPATQPATSEASDVSGGSVLALSVVPELAPTELEACTERLFLLAPKQSPPARAS